MMDSCVARSGHGDSARGRFLGASAPLRFGLLALLAVLASAGCGNDSASGPGGGGNPPPGRPTLPETYLPSGHMAAGDVFVHLFEWKWTDIAAECENVLGPAGFRAVQVSPPQEHSLEPPIFPWSQRYQPVSYSVAKSRSGTGLEFQDMVQRCGAAGVDIYVDAVINHMTNHPSPGVGSNGTSYSKYEYPGLYTQTDFHTPCALNNYQSAANVQDCELLSLPDLNTGMESVRQKIAGYLVGLVEMGVDGFRIDAAKHIQQVELDRIMAITDSTLEARGRAVPYYFLEVIAGSGEALTPRHYFGAGYSSGASSDITEFTFIGVGDKFRGIGGQYLAQLNPNGTPGNRFSEAAWGLMPTNKAVVFLQNHDTQRSCGLGYQHGDTFRRANVWMLAQPYGYPSVLSGYAFACPSQNTNGPPSDGNGNTGNVACAAVMEAAVTGEWVCEHRSPSILAMVGFRRTVAGTPIAHWWDNGANAIAFARGDRGFVALNGESTPLMESLQTGLAQGQYCDRLTGGKSGATCAGLEVTVDAQGQASITLPAGAALAIDVSTRL